MQRALDTVLGQAATDARERFSATGSDASATHTGLHVAIAVVTRQDHVLLVQRRDSGLLNWQFPAGVVKPEQSAERVAIHETKFETAIDTTISREIGARLHPITGVYCRYFLCDYLAGEAVNQDVVENASVAWAPISGLSRFIPAANIYPPVLDVLGVAQ